MNTQRWQQVRRIFEEAVALPLPERMPFVDAACAEDAALRTEVLGLLEADADDTPFLDDGLPQEALRLFAKEALPNHQGQRIGPYEVVRELGHGGMGTVFLAKRVDGQFTQQVAIKRVRYGRHHEALVQRFQQERQILASLQHPHIARLLDGGVTDEGVPYLVMEYVDGIPLDQYGEQQQLSTADRIRLFQTVCDAVQYAHQNLIVHRDLKPSNILVTGDGTVKLLDFGIAKLLGPEPSDSLLTGTGWHLLTPAYASPEQVKGTPITTASDVYSLGIILYELLTGQRPYEVKGLTASAIERLICEDDPPKPSTAVVRISEATPGEPATRLQRRLRGDLDTIVLKALHKDPARRYGSPAELGDDLRRHLAQLPVMAQPDRLGYRLAKFVRRNTVGVGAAALLVVVLLGGIIATTRQAQVAERRFSQVRTLSNTLLSDLHDSIRDLPGATSARRLLVANALTYLDVLHQEAGGDPALQLELAAAYEQIGEIQGDPHYTNLGDLAGAMDSYQKAFALRQELWHRDTLNATTRHALANSYGDLAVTWSWSKDNQRAIALSQRALALLRPLATARPEDGPVHHDMGRIRSELGWWLIWERRFDEGLAHLDTAITQLEAVVQRYPANIDMNLHLWRAYSYEVDGLRFSGRYQDALDVVDPTGLALLHRLEQRVPSQPRVLYGLHVAYNYVGLMHIAMQQPEAAIPPYETSLAYAERLVAQDSTNSKANEALSRSYVAVASTLASMGKVDASAAAFETGVRIRKAAYEDTPRAVSNSYSNSLRLYCRMLLLNNREEAALPICQEAATVLEDLIASGDVSAIVMGNLGYTYGHMARIHRLMGHQATIAEERTTHREQALAYYARSINLLKPERTDDAQTTAWELHPDSLLAEHDALLRIVGGPVE